MKEGWTYKTLPDISENLDSIRRPVTKSKRTTGIYPYYGASGIVDYVDDYLFNEDLLCISEDGANLLMRTYPIAFPISGKVWVNNHAHVLRFKSMITQKYVEYYFSGMKLDEYITGAAQPKLTQKALNNIKIYIPSSIDEQQSIVDYLDSAFAKIDAMKANAEKALNEAKALLQASLKEMLEPKEGWEENTLKVLTSKIGSGATPKGGRKVYVEKGCHLIRSMNVQYNEFKYDDLAHITDEAAEQLKGVEIQENDVLFNITGASIARCCVVPVDAVPARVNQHVSILRLNQEVLPRFLSFILNSPQHQKELLEIGEAGSTRQALTKTDLENHVISYPSIDKQVELICTLDSLKSKVDRLQENYDKISQECDALKQAILRQVFE